MREQTGDLWDFWSTGAYIGITTNGRVARSGAAVMGAGLAKVAALRFPSLAHQLGEFLTRSGNHVYAFPDHRVFSIPTKDDPFEPSLLPLITQSADELLRYVDNMGLQDVYTVRLGCGLGQLHWDAVRPILSARWDDRFVILSPPKP